MDLDDDVEEVHGEDETSYVATGSVQVMLAAVLSISAFAEKRWRGWGGRVST